MEIHEIKALHQAKLTAIFEELGAFFAFNDKQFESQAKKGVVYATLECGTICPADKVEAYHKKMKDLEAEMRQIHDDNTDLDDIIRAELANHECYYTSDWSLAYEVIKLSHPSCTEEDMQRVYDAELPKHLEDM